MNNTEIGMAVHKQLKDNHSILIDMNFNNSIAHKSACSFCPKQSAYITSYLWSNLNKALQPVKIRIRFSALPPYN